MPKARVNLLLSITNGFWNSYIISTISRAPGTNNPTRRIISVLMALIFGVCPVSMKSMVISSRWVMAGGLGTCQT